MNMLGCLIVLCGALVSAGVHAEVLSPFESFLPEGRIVGGVATNIEKYPHQISMRYHGRHRCGGSVYTSNIIVSAAHCVVGLTDENVKNLSIVAGSTFLDQEGQEIFVRKYIIHEQHSTATQNNDVAVLVLNGEFKFSDSVKSIALASQRPDTGSEVTVTGWGTTEEGATWVPNQLQKVNLFIRDRATCRRAYPFLFTSNMMCASVDNGGKDSCQGDSGGPLVFNNELVGIVSWGIGCARPNYPGVYASVADLKEWIETTAKNNTIKSYIDFL